MNAVLVNFIKGKIVQAERNLKIREEQARVAGFTKTSCRSGQCGPPFGYRERTELKMFQDVLNELLK